MVKEIEVRLPHKFIARDYQLSLLRAIQSQGIKRACSVWHRRAGKDKSAFNLIVSQASRHRVGIYYYFFPTYNQGRKILWDGIDKDGFPFRAHIPKELIASENSSEMKITLKNGSIIQIIGTDNIDSIVGTNPVGCVFTEYALQNPQAWDYIRPILTENGGWAVFLFTPRGKNHGWELYKMARDNPDWFCEMLTVNNTGVITPGMIDEERRAGMSEEMIQQEFYCSFEASNPGAYYAQEMRLIREQGRICGVPVETNLPVNTYWDLGMDDSTSIWLAQDVGREIHLVGYYESVGVKISVDVAYLKEWIAKRQATWGYWMLPHDGENRSKQTGKSTRDFLRDLGFRDVRIAPRPNRKEDGIEAVRQVLGKCWFDSVECDKGVEALCQYRKEWNEVNKVFKYAPVHDWASHGADAFQTMAIGHPGNLFLYNTMFTGNNFEIHKEIENEDNPLRFGMRRPQQNHYVSMR